MSTFYIVACSDEKIRPYANLSKENHRRYALKHGYLYDHYDLDHVRSQRGDLIHYTAPWLLIWAMKHTLSKMAEGSWVMLLGADALVINERVSLESIINIYAQNENTNMLVTRDMNGLNTGGLMVRNCEWSRDFIDAIWEERGQYFDITGPDGYVHKWEEQGAIIKWLEKQLTTTHWQYIPQEITNGYYPDLYGQDYNEPLFIAHFPGKSTEERYQIFKRILEPES
jgi:hypothetical protein